MANLISNIWKFFRLKYYVHHYLGVEQFYLQQRRETDFLFNPAAHVIHTENMFYIRMFGPLHLRPWC